MARIYSVRMAMGSAAPGAPVVIYTCPAGRVAILRDITVDPLAAGATSFQFDINLSGVVFSGVGAVQFSTQQWTGRTVMVAGDTLNLGVGGGSFRYIVSGYELSP